MHYKYSENAPVHPRCRNLYTLNTLHGSGGPAILSKDIPPNYIWINSNGYGFDVRNLAVLLKVNFRNINPHKIDEHIWCNQSDLDSIVNHPWLGPKLKKVYEPRVKLLNSMSENLRHTLSKAAIELASVDMNGFYTWLQNKETFEIVKASIGSENLTMESAVLNLRKTVMGLRKTAELAIQSHSPTQASEHRFEPGGLKVNGTLYRFLEVYKAGVARKLLDDLDTIRKNCAEVRNRLDKAIWQEQSESLTHLSLILIQRLNSRVRNREALFMHMLNKGMYLLWKVVFDNDSKVELYHDFTEDSYIVITPHHQPNNHILFRVDENLNNIIDVVDKHMHIIDAKSVKTAGIAGAFQKMGKRWTNILQTSMTLCCQKFTDAIISNYWENTKDKTIYKHRITRNMYNDIMRNVVNICDERALDALVMNAGCDDNIATLESKLWLSLNGETCIQDVGTTLCELLSVPYDPNHYTFKLLDPNHTGIPKQIHS